MHITRTSDCWLLIALSTICFLRLFTEHYSNQSCAPVEVWYMDVLSTASESYSIHIGAPPHMTKLDLLDFESHRDADTCCRPRRLWFLINWRFITWGRDAMNSGRPFKYFVIFCGLINWDVIIYIQWPQEAGPPPLYITSLWTPVTRPEAVMSIMRKSLIYYMGVASSLAWKNTWKWRKG